jgi:3-(3-hydroxy-phenyl)propionate hydroxylase
MINSGRLSTPTAYSASPLSTPDAEVWPGGPPPGAPISDGRLVRPDGAPAYLSECLAADFTLITMEEGARAACPRGVALLKLGAGGYGDPHGEIAERFALLPGAAYLIRPDRHIAARFGSPDKAGVVAALRRARGKDLAR